MRGRWAVGLVAAMAALYAAGPLWAGWHLRQAVRTRDVAALEARVDWPQLRANLRPRLAEAITESAAQSGAIGGAVKRTLGAVISGPAVATLVTPANLGRLLAGRAFMLNTLPGTWTGAGKPGAGAQPSANDDSEDVDDPMPPRRLRWAFFDGLTRFRIEATHPRLAPSRIGATLALEGWTWKLVDVEIVKR